ncbi:Sn1-specific diacylglycerol lipase beta [Cytospora mali]|uniref:sn-1-specific diacylglycerol lipase n=1 Tax=Cytospora mali TaxID=578113 RepID=A0A194UZK2_CYTMA|nr:Sn1-specific diacylglycerol lipase beta [Valsa mali var. pyri (nom. inval.)]
MAGTQEREDSLEGDDQLTTSTPGDLGATQRQLHPTSVPGRTLLPSPIASAVSLWTRSAGLALRVGTVIGGYGLGAAKATTLSSLELGRGIIEGILHRAGNEAFLRSNSEFGRTDAETVMERSLESLHTAMSQVVFWTTAGFQLTGTTISTISEVSQLTLSYLDSILGSTESSRAIASIITLIRREFSNPATGQLGEKVGVFDLIVGMVGMAYFQRCAWKLIEEESRRLQVEETLWDVVILNDEEMMDYSRVHNGKRRGVASADDPNEEVIQTIQKHGADDSTDGEDDLPETRLKQHIMRTLPAGAKVSITTETKTTKTITVDVSGTQPSALALPVGVELIEETRLPPASPHGSQGWSMSSDQRGNGSNSPDATYRVVYRVSKNKLRGTEMAREAEQNELPRFVEQIDDADTDCSVDDVATSDDEEDDDMPPSPPPKSPPRRQQESSLETLHRAAELQARASRSGQGRHSPVQTRKGSIDKYSQLPLPKQGPETSANQKRPRMPASSPTSSSSTDHPRKKQQSMQSMSKLLSRKTRGDTTPPIATNSSSEKKSGLRNALKRGSSSTLSNLGAKDGKDAATTNASVGSKGKQPAKDRHRTSQSNQKPSSSAAKHHLSVPSRDSSLVPKRDVPRPSKGGTYRSPLTSRALAEYESADAIPRSPSRASLISIHERKRDSLVSQTDTFSLRYADNLRPVSPTYVARHSSMAISRPERDIIDRQQPPPSPSHNHARAVSRLYSPSIYTLRPNDSQTSLVPYYQRSPFGDAEALSTLRRTGTIDTIFPRFHLLRNITRFMRFSSASYGSNFLKVFGISKTMPPSLKAVDDTHHELRMFAHHTQSRPQSILLSSFVDSQGGSDSSGSTETGVPLVHYISLDDESKAVVLACRGTLGFEDVLADMTCDYDDLFWRGKSYKVHKGVHASARRLLYGGDGRVLVTIKAALEQNPDYGLVLCGHSLGGAVTALLGVMLSEPLDGGTSFVTSDEPHSRLLPSLASNTTQSHICLPSGRPIHVYAYGPPATMSLSLRKATRGLITSVVHGQDLVPYLSLGVLHDFQAVALAFKADNGDAKQEIKTRVWEALQGGLMDKWRGGASKKDGHVSEEDEEWAFAAFKTLRASMMSNKLMPPGEVFIVETEKVLRRDAFVRPGEDDDHGGKHDEAGRDKSQKAYKYIGRPARRIVLKYVRDVEARFKEVRFGATMLTDHNPARYEDALDGLRFGVVEA